MRPDQGVLRTIASVESITQVYRTTCFDGAGRIQPQMAAPVIRIASGITAYSIALSRWLPFLPFAVGVARVSAEERLGGPSTESSVDATRPCAAFSCTPLTVVSVIA